MTAYPLGRKNGRPAGQMNLLRGSILTSLLIAAGRADAVDLTVDPGAAGTRYFYADFQFVGALGGTAMNGQTESVNIRFGENKFAVAGKLSIDFLICQSGDLGVWPASFSSVTGFLLDFAGNASYGPVDLNPSGSYPTQVWPGWGYYLPDGTEYFPATTAYSAPLSGSPINLQPDGSRYLEPMIFSGIHFDITFPQTPPTSTLGLRMHLSNYSDFYDGDWHNPIYISPNSLPVFFVPEPSTVSLVAVMGVAWFSRRHAHRSQ